MAELNLPNDIQNALQSFFKNSEIKVFEAGLEEDRPERIQDRPFFSVVPENETAWLTKNRLSKTEGSYNLNIGKREDDGSLKTESHEFIQEVEKRFRDLQPDAKLFIIDPDVIMGRYAQDTSRDRSVAKSMLEFLQEKLNENKITEHKVEPGDDGLFVPAAISGNSPFSLPLPTGVSEENLAGTGKICIVVASNPDKVMHELWTEIPGSRERMDALGIDFDATRRMVLYHELGHAMDIWSKAGKNPVTSKNITDQTFERHRTECLADTFATLQTARDFKSTDTAELMADLRACFAHDGYQRSTPEYRAKMKMFGILGEQWKQHEKDKKLEKKLGIAEEPNKETKSVKRLEKAAEDFKVLESVEMTLAYNVNPVTDVAIKVAKEGLKDGSLLKMTDKEVLELAARIVEENAFDRNRLNKAAYDVLKGNKDNPDLQAIEKRYQKSLDSMPLSKAEMTKRLEENRKKEDEARDKAIRKRLALKVDEVAPQQDPKQAKELMKWIENIFDSIEEKDGTTSAIVSVVSEEKDKLRTSDKDKLQPSKIALLNNIFIAQAPEIELTNKATKAVTNSLETLDVKIEGTETLSGSALLNEFIQTEIANAQKGVQIMQNKQNDDFASMDIAQMEKAQQKEQQEYVEILAGEKTSQVLAKKIRSDKDAWKIVTNSDKMRDIVTKKALGKPAEWLASYHISLVERNQGRQEDVIKGILLSNKSCITAVQEINAKVSAQAKSVDASKEKGVDKKEKGSSKKKTSSQKTENPKTITGIMQKRANQR